MMHVHQVPIASLQPDPANARRHSPANLKAIKASLQRFGQQKPIVVNAANVVVAGHGTLEAARLLGWQQISVVRTSLAEPEAAAFAIADNRTAELAQWNPRQLAQTLGDIHRSPDLELADVGYSRQQLRDLLDALDPPPAAPLPTIHEVLVQCADAADQQRAWELLTHAGYSCRVLTL